MSCKGLPFSLLVIALASPTAVGQSVRESTSQSVARDRGAAAAVKPDLGEVRELIFSLANDFRAENGRGRLRENEYLTQAADYFAHYLAQTDQFSHTADGKEPWDRAAEHGYQYCIILENIAWEFNSEGFTARGLAAGFMDGWKQSPGHRRNLLDKDVSDTGVGVAHSSETGRFYAVQMFGRPKSDAVVFKVSNRSEAAVTMKLDGKAQTVRPGYTMTYTRCRPPEVVFPAESSGGKPRVLHPAKGTTYTITADDSGGIRVAEE